MKPTSFSITVLNPNSNQSVTDAMSDALDGFRHSEGPSIICETLSDGPFGIETQDHIDHVVPLVEKRARLLKADALVISCYSDPGLTRARAVTRKPVFGIGRSGLLAALSIADKIGVISILETSIPRHMAYAQALGIKDKIVGDRAIGLGVAELASGDVVEHRLIEVGKHLRDLDGAEALVLGCAGMARYRSAVEHALGLPVIDPVQAATGDAYHAIMRANG